MKKIIIFILIIFVITFLMLATPQLNKSDLAKNVLAKTSSSIVKIIAHNGMTYIATGVIIDKNIIVSTYKIAKKGSKFDILTIDNKRYRAKLLGKDRLSSLSIFKIENSSLKPIRFSENTEIGEWIALIGVSYENFPTIYQGILSSKKEDSLLLNAPIVPGLSGGAVVNKKGELLGIVKGGVGFSLSPSYVYKDINEEMIIKGEEFSGNNLCYAIPSKIVKKVKSQIIKFGKVKRGWLGVYLNERNGKVYIEKVLENTPAKKYGLKKGDIIEKINGKQVNTYDDIVRMVRNFMPGEWIKIKIIRDGRPKTIKLKVGTLKYDFESEKISEDEDFNIRRRLPDFKFFNFPKSDKIIFSFTSNRHLGINVYELTPALAKKFKIKEGYGLLISKVLKDSPAEKTGLKAGDIIVRAKNKPVKSIEDIRAILNSLKDNEKVRIDYYRDGKLKSVLVLPEKSDESFIKALKKLKDMKKKFFELSEQERLKREINRLKEEIKKLNEANKSRISSELKREIRKLKKEIENILEKYKQKKEED